MGITPLRSKFNPNQLRIALIIWLVIPSPYTQNGMFCKHCQAGQHLAAAPAQRRILIDPVVRGDNEQRSEAIAIGGRQEWDQQNQEDRTHDQNHGIEALLDHEQDEQCIDCQYQIRAAAVSIENYIEKDSQDEDSRKLLNCFFFVNDSKKDQGRHRHQYLSPKVGGIDRAAYAWS